MVNNFRYIRAILFSVILDSYVKLNRMRLIKRMRCLFQLFDFIDLGLTILHSLQYSGSNIKRIQIETIKFVSEKPMRSLLNSCIYADWEYRSTGKLFACNNFSMFKMNITNGQRMRNSDHQLRIVSGQFYPKY